MTQRQQSDAKRGAGFSRRTALKAGGLTVAFVWAGSASKSAMAWINPRHQPGDTAAALADGAPAFAPNAFIRIDVDGGIRLVMPMVEMGQAIYTGSAMLIAEELGVELDQVRVEHSPPSEELYGMPLLGGQATGGSTSTRSTYKVLREAGAVARSLLISAAAGHWGVDPVNCTAVRGAVVHSPSGRRLGYGSLATAAAKLPMPVTVALKEPKDFSIVGKRVRRVDAGDKVTGAALFGLDTRVPGMKVASVKASPTFGGTVRSVDDKAARNIPGVVDVLRLGNAVAVVGEHYWAAKRGLDELKIEWSRGDNASLTTAQLADALERASSTGKSIVGREVGIRPEGIAVEATYRLPMLAHAPMEPLNTTVHVTAGKCEIWVGTQVPTRAVAAAAHVTGLPEGSILLHNQFLGGGFGRRLEVDSIEQAVAFAKQVPYPLKVMWSREEDIQHDFVRPMYNDKVTAVLDPGGRITWFGDRITSSSVLGRWLPMAMGKNGVDSDAIECAAVTPYSIPALKVEWFRHEMPRGLVTGWWRGVGSTHNLFVVESFIDELAHRANADPVAYRRAMMLENPRSLALLDLASSKFGWDTKKPVGRVGWGVALGEPFGSRVCAMIEVDVSPQGEVRVTRAIVTLDCGIVINIGSVEAQIEGGLLFGLSAALFNKITIEAGAVQQSNFHDYRSMRISEAPSIEVHTVKSAEPPGGLGEVGTAIAAPALCNAIFAATGVRLRELPVDRALLSLKPAELRKVVGGRGMRGDSA